MKKTYITALVIVLVLVSIVVILSNQNKKSTVDFYVSKYSPNSLAYFICKSEGMKDGNKCQFCENLFSDFDSRRTELKITTDQQLIDLVRAKDIECVNEVQGGN